MPSRRLPATATIPRKKTEGLTISGKTYTTTSAYNTRGELTQLTYPDATIVQRTYTARGELYSLKHAGMTVVVRIYDNGGRLVTDAYNNTVTETRTYNLDNTLASISDNKSIGDLNYTWDANKNKTAETISGTMSNYGFSIPSGGYDDEDRLTSFNRTVGLTQSWNLSLVGDWNSVTTNGTAQARTLGPSHELLTGAGGAVSTDVKGNITVIPAALRPSGVALAMTWDFDNRMATAVTGSTTVSHKYDALGRRVARTEGANTTIYAQSGQQTVCDYVAGAAPTASTYRYLFASYIDEPVVRITTSGSVATYLHRNQQYSITALTNSTGAVVERYAYTAYGVPTITNASGTVLTSSAQNNRYLYTGREWDGAISLYHYRARMYDASLGRFCSRDPIGFEGSKWGLYAYLDCKPTTGVDPQGLTRGGDQNKMPSDCTTQTTIKEVQEKMEEAKKAGKMKHYKALKGWLKILKRGGPNCILPIAIWWNISGTCSAGEPAFDPPCSCKCVTEVESERTMLGIFPVNEIQTSIVAEEPPYPSPPEVCGTTSVSTTYQTRFPYRIRTSVSRVCICE